jgi:hypothetical protein
MKFLTLIFSVIGLINIFPSNANCQVGKSDKPLWVAIVRADGILIPFAQYDGNKWRKPWPEADQDINKDIVGGLSKIPQSWLGVSKQIPTTWYFTSIKKHESKILNVSVPETFNTHCGGGHGLLTDYSPTETFDGAPFPKVGLATDLNVNIQSPVVLDLKKMRV